MDWVRGEPVLGCAPCPNVLASPPAPITAVLPVGYEELYGDALGPRAPLPPRQGMSVGTHSTCMHA